MIINFNITRQSENGLVEYFNSRGQVVISYSLGGLIEYASKHPHCYLYDDLNDFIDDNWLSLTEGFYMAMNPHVYKANNRPQQTKKV